MRNYAEDRYRSYMSVDGGIQFMNNQINALRSNVINLQENIEKTKIDPEKMFNELREKQITIENNKAIIKEKMKILEGRNRMLQVSMDKNIFYKKLVYVLIAIAISVIVIILFAVSFFKSN